MIRSLEVTGDRKNSTALEAGRQLKSGSGQVIGLAGYNDGPEQYIQLFDALAAANGSVPFFTFKVAAKATFSLDGPVKFTTGLYIGNSTTAATRTTGAANCWFLAQVV